jgi:hypothetical protein
MFIATTAQIAGAAKNNIISEKTAVSLITKHIKDAHWCIRKMKFGFNSNNGTPAIVEIYKKIEDLGYLQIEIQKSKGGIQELMAGGNNSFVKLKLTDLGEQISLPSDKNNKCLPIGERKVLKIFRINNDNTVLFSYHYKPNDIGKISGYEASKYRGQAKFKHDIFLDEYKFMAFYFSIWEKEEWQHTSTWLCGHNNSIVCAGIK